MAIDSDPEDPTPLEAEALKAENQRKLMALVGVLDGLYENYDHEAEMNDAWPK